MSYYKYYPKYVGESNRPEWLSYMDDLIAVGRIYTHKVKESKDYESLNDIEYRTLITLLFQDNTLMEKEEIMLSGDTETMAECMAYFVQLGCNSPSSEERITQIISNNIMSYFKPVIEDIFAEIRQDLSLQGDVEHE